MPTLKDFMEHFRWNEAAVCLAIIAGITASHEWRNVLRIFSHGKKEKE